MDLIVREVEATPVWRACGCVVMPADGEAL
jgi:hypothetical protein